MTLDLYFAIPGNLDTLTGGYAYDRRLLDELRKRALHVEHLPLPAGFPFPSDEALVRTEQCFAALPNDALVLIDGLAFGAMPECALRHAQRLQLVALCHHPLALENGLSPQQQRTLHDSETLALQAARSIIVTSEATAHTLVSVFGIANAKICVARPGTDRPPFAPCDGSPPRLLTVASLTPRKAHDVLIDALAQIADLPWQARFVGGAHFNPDWSAALLAQIARKGLDERIECVGDSDNVELQYQQADLFVLPSRYEGYGMVFAEALANGLPVLAARAGAVPDVVPESAGILVPPDDAQALAEALRKVLTDRDVYSQLRAGAQRAAADLPTWADTATTIATHLQRLQAQ